MRTLWLVLCGLLAMGACGGGGSGSQSYTPPPISLALSPSTQSDIDQGQSLNFTATVTNDASGKGVTWSASGSGMTGPACGTFTNVTTTTATYTAPSPVSANLSITITATSVADPTKSGSAMVVISPPPTIVTATLPNATPNTTYSATLQATGGVVPLTWSLASGALPTGLSLSSSGVISGVPTSPGTSAFAVQVTDASVGFNDPASVQAQLSLTVVTVLNIATTTLPAGPEGVAYLTDLVASGGTPPYVWSLAASSLPPGLTLQSSSGVISGTPTSQGSFTFTVAAQDSSPTKQTRTQSLTITIGAPEPLVITTAALTNASPNTNYSVTLQATGGVGPLTWSLTSGALPTGLSLSSSGVITGDPTIPGTSTFTVQVTDSSDPPSSSASAQAQLSLTVVTVLNIATTALPAGSEGITYLAAIDASGGTPPYVWNLAASSLPPGLTLESSSGVISGTPTSQGSFTFTVAVQDSSPTKQTQNQPISVAIGAPGPLTILTSSLLDGIVGTPYNAKLVAAGGQPPYTWSIPVGALPAGVSLSSSTGAITGTPSATGTANFTVLVTDSSSVHETQEAVISLTINNPGEACGSSGNNAILNGPYAFLLSGFNDVGFLVVVGSFTADGTGKITGGEADTNGVLGAQQGNILTSLSSYSVGADNRGCATLATPFGTFLTRFALGGISSGTATGGRIIAWDSPSASAYIATGQLQRQTSSVFATGLSGSFVFQTIGWDSATLGGRDVCVGVFGASGNTFTTFEQDCNDAWTVSNTTVPADAGSYTALDANGRGTGIIALGEFNSNITFYAVSSSQLLMVNADSNPTSSGAMQQQNVPSGGAGFTSASLKGNLILYLNGMSLGGTASAASLETATADGSSSMTIKFYEDRAGTLQGSDALTCSYAVEPSGRVTLSSSTQACGGNPPVLYLTDLNTGFILDTAPGVDTGSFEPQSAGPFNNASISGNFSGGMVEVVSQNAPAEVSAIAPDGNGNITGTSEIISTSFQNPGSPFLAATYAVNSDGTFSVSSSGGTVGGVIVSGSKFVMFSPSAFGTAYPTALVMQK